MMDTKIKKLTKKISDEMAFQLQDKWVGTYFHGSLRLGGFSWHHSDVDFILVVNDSLNEDEKKRICDWMMGHRDEFPAKGFEFSVVLEKNCRNFVYPTPYELHMSKAYEQIYECYPQCVLCKEERYDADLASHFHILHVECDELDFGKKVSEVFTCIDMDLVLHANWLDVVQSNENVIKEPIDVILNLCRFYALLTENKTLSKVDGGKCALDTFSFEDVELIKMALDAYECQKKIDWNSKHTQQFVCQAMLVIQSHQRFFQFQRELQKRGICL